VSGELLFQSRNIARARIRGLDLRFQAELAEWAARLRGWRLSLAAFWSEGENRESGAPLNSIAPPQAVIGLQWTSADGSWDLHATLTGTAAKKQSDIDVADGARYATRSWAALDLSAGWRPGSHVEFRAAVFNATDRTYWRWLDVANLAADDPMIPLLSRPGRSYSVSARLMF
jgi:hemoglobin/transferrin/lactoferrin receptor protein